MNKLKIIIRYHVYILFNNTDEAFLHFKVFKIHTNKKPLKDVDLEELATLTDGYSGAEIAAVCNEAALKALEDLMATPMTDEQVNIRNHK